MLLQVCSVTQLGPWLWWMIMLPNNDKIDYSLEKFTSPILFFSIQLHRYWCLPTVFVKILLRGGKAPHSLRGVMDGQTLSSSNRLPVKYRVFMDLFSKTEVHSIIKGASPSSNFSTHRRTDERGNRQRQQRLILVSSSANFLLFSVNQRWIIAKVLQFSSTIRDGLAEAVQTTAVCLPPFPEGDSARYYK